MNVFLRPETVQQLRVHPSIAWDDRLDLNAYRMRSAHAELVRHCCDCDSAPGGNDEGDTKGLEVL